MSYICSDVYLQQTEEILRDYISHRILMNDEIKSRAEIVKAVSRDLNEPVRLNSRIFEIVRDLAFEFERRYRDSYKSQHCEMSSQSLCDSADARLSFEAVTSELFQGGWRWARVIALISYVGLLAEATATHSIYAPDERINEIIEWTINLFQSMEASAFFGSCGGWDGFLEWYGNSDARSLTNAVPFPKQVAVVGLVAAVMAGLSFMVGRFVA